MDEEVLTYNGIVLRRSDMDILEGPCYLNDQLIAFYFQHLSSVFDSDDILLPPPSISFFLTNSEDPDSVKELLDLLELSSKNLVLFAINNNDDLDGADGGTHWSLLAYHRGINAFGHHDSMEGVNNLYAMKLYDAVKGFMGSTAARPSTAATKGRNKKKNDSKPASKTSQATPTAEPCFMECPSPQQTNGYDCGLYVIAVARAICQWNSRKAKGKEDNWFADVRKNVNVSVETKMREEVLSLIEELKSEG